MALEEYLERNGSALAKGLGIGIVSYCLADNAVELYYGLADLFNSPAFPLQSVREGVTEAVQIGSAVVLGGGYILDKHD